MADRSFATERTLIKKVFSTGSWKIVLRQLNGKELSYNNLLDIDSAINLMAEFSEPSFAIIKHNNACGLASRHFSTVRPRLPHCRQILFPHLVVC